MGDSMLLCDTSLTDMLASDNVPKSTSDDACSLVNESPDDAIFRLEARVLAGDIELQGVCDERAAMQHQVDLLMSEIDSFNKKDKAQKIEIKRLTRDNDKLKKDISKFNGMRKYMGADEQNSTVTNIVNNTERCNSHKCKLLRSKLIGVTDSLLTALDDDNDNDVAVVNGAKRNQPAPGPRQAHPPISTTSNGPVSFATVAATRTSRTRLEAPRHAPRMQSASSSPQPIPVVEIGAAARHAVRPGGGAARETSERSHTSEPTRPSAPHNGETIVIGTSLVRGLGAALNRQGIPVSSYTYPGADIPTIRSRIPGILPPRAAPARIVLQVAGNDATKQPAEKIAPRYESLINDIRRRCPHATILLSKVPPRKGPNKTMDTIVEVNRIIDNFASRFSNVHVINVCPTSLYHFRKDGIHFNAAGVNHYSYNMATALRNFQSPQLSPLV